MAANHATPDEERRQDLRADRLWLLCAGSAMPPGIASGCVVQRIGDRVQVATEEPDVDIRGRGKEAFLRAALRARTFRLCAQRD
jgi:hypothetical protein